MSSALGIGVATVAKDGRILDTWFPDPTLDPEDELIGRLFGAGVPRDGGTARLDAGMLSELLGTNMAGALGDDALREVTLCGVATWLPDLDAPPRDAHDVYLRLHLLSHRLVTPHGLDLTGVFALLCNVAWTDLGPVAVDLLDEVRLRARAAGRRLTVDSVDKFPKMTDYVVPSGIRIADAARVRLGAHLAPGTTVMHEGFCNFNAGTLGKSMVEGRISAGVVVGDGTDVGGGSSIMGTLSGGGQQVISLGTSCLVGANAGIGISLGNRCVVEAGVYVTAGAKVRLPDGTVAKARSLSGVDDLLFRRNSLSGSLEVVVREGATVADWGGLNSALHHND